MKDTRKLTITGIFASLITIMTAYVFHIPVGVNGGYVHLGDALIFLSATLLPKPYALAAAAIGGGMADLLTAPMWVPATVVIKMLLVLAFTDKSAKIITVRNMLAIVLGFFISWFGYFIAEYLLFGNWSLLILSLGHNLVQIGGSAIVFLVLGTAFDKAKIKTRFFMS